MAKARTLVGLDVHAAKVVAAILDAETGELRFQRLGGDSEPRERSSARVSSAWSRRRARSRAGRPRGSRPTDATPSTWSACFSPAGSTRSGFRGRPRRHCATWSVPARTSAAI